MFTSVSKDWEGQLVDAFLDLEKLDLNLYRSHHQLPHLESKVIYGGQVIGQSLIAAYNTVPEDFSPHSLHCYFIRPGQSTMPVLYQVDRVRDGRSYCTRGVKAIQNGENIFTCQVSFCKEEGDSIKHQITMPVVPSPDSLKDIEDLLKEVASREELVKAATPEQRKGVELRLQAQTNFSCRPCDPQAYLRMKSVSPAKLMLWVKSKAELGEDQRLHQCVAAFISDHSIIPTALLPHRGGAFKVGMSLSLDHTIWFHKRKFSMSEWLLYETESTVASSSRAMCFGRLWTREGELVLSVAQECLIRPKKDDALDRSYL